MATDYDAVIADWETNGPARVQEKIDQLKDVLKTSISDGMKANVQKNIDALEADPTAYINGVIQNYHRAKIANAQRLAEQEAVMQEEDV